MIRDRYRVVSTDDLPDLMVLAADVGDLLNQVQAHVDMHRTVLDDFDQPVPAGFLADVDVLPATWDQSAPIRRRVGHNGTGVIVDPADVQVATLAITWSGYRDLDVEL